MKNYIWIILIPFLGITQSEKKLALVIGNANYQDPTAELKNPLNDAKLMSETFNALEFDSVIVVNDAGGDEMEDAFTNYKKAMRSDFNVGFIYYSGHGYVNPQNQKQYFLTVDSDDDLLDLTAVSQDDFYKYLDELSYSEINLFIDACFSGDNSSKDGSFVGREYIPGEGTKGSRISLDKKTSWSNYKNIKDKAFVLSATNSKGRAYTFNFISKERNKLGLNDPINNVSENSNFNKR